MFRHIVSHAPNAFKLCLLLLGASLLVSCKITKTVDPDDPPASGTTVFDMYVLQTDRDKAFNVLFVPDTAYGDMSVLANRQAFVNDMASVIENAYWQNRAYFNAWGRFNYFYMTASGTVTERPLTPDGKFQCPTVSWPSQVNTDGAFADQIILIHKNELRDCGGGGRATAEPTSFRTIVHETGHGLFGLPDEYCCDGGYFTLAPVMYATQAACTGDAANAGWRNCQSHTSSRDGSTWWRSQGNITTNLIMSSGGNEVWESGPADWAVMRAAYSTLSGSPTITAPATFAPAQWSYTVPPPWSP
ncbi:hypothetical protein KY495_23330 [Massilia sp. PAMC28688]|uniref:hypothetical protein n=1 Tax=Massilia sp. PAMC28688 TaxID=2861283 RepID=UPI001C6277BF|nr:hypothetical protein [Massilia sp. PAMC28688]QYF93553.1 hypothetical protein KY495_23330 [Massilia sp. PAMC28688]